MRSILYQLNKYSQQPDNKVVSVSTTPNQNGEGPIDLSDIANWLSDDEPERKRIYTALQSMPFYPMAGKLYPVTVLAMWHLASQCFMIDESKCDSEIFGFISRQNKTEYEKLFLEKCNGIVRRIILARALYGTFHFTNNHRDKIPVEHRKQLCSMLGVICNNVKTASDILDNANKAGNLEHRILGRFGYIILWNLIYKRDEQVSSQVISQFTCKSITLLPSGQDHDDSRPA